LAVFRDHILVTQNQLKQPRRLRFRCLWFIL